MELVQRSQRAISLELGRALPPTDLYVGEMEEVCPGSCMGGKRVEKKEGKKVEKQAIQGSFHLERIEGCSYYSLLLHVVEAVEAVIAAAAD